MWVEQTHSAFDISLTPASVCLVQNQKHKHILAHMLTHSHAAKSYSMGNKNHMNEVQNGTVH